MKAGVHLLLAARNARFRMVNSSILLKYLILISSLNFYFIYIFVLAVPWALTFSVADQCTNDEENGNKVK